MAQNIFFVRIKLDVKLDPRMFIYLLILKTPSLVCVCVFALGHSYVFMCISVPVRYLEMVDKFWRKNYFYNCTHTISKLRLLETFSQKNFEKQVSNFKKRRNFWKSKDIDKFTPVTLLLEKYFYTFLLTWRFQYSTNANSSYWKFKDFQFKRNGMYGHLVKPVTDFLTSFFSGKSSFWMTSQ